jgi:hypothetical protein
LKTAESRTSARTTWQKTEGRASESQFRRSQRDLHPSHVGLDGQEHQRGRVLEDHLAALVQGKEFFRNELQKQTAATLGQLLLAPQAKSNDASRPSQEILGPMELLDSDSNFFGNPIAQRSGQPLAAVEQLFSKLPLQEHRHVDILILQKVASNFFCFEVHHGDRCCNEEGMMMVVVVVIAVERLRRLVAAGRTHGKSCILIGLHQHFRRHNALKFESQMLAHIWQHFLKFSNILAKNI